MDKHQIRKKLLALRKNQNPKFKANFEEQIFQFIKQWNVFENAKSIGIYFSTKNELDTSKIINHILASNKKCYLPVISNKENTFDFYLYKKNIKLIPNKYKILEPEIKNENKIDVNSLDIIFVPIVGFNKNKDRLGMGGGFYDRVLARLNNVNKKAMIVGLAFDFQKDNNFKAEEWDINLDIVLTEKKIYE